MAGAAPLPIVGDRPASRLSQHGGNFQLAVRPNTQSTARSRISLPQLGPPSRVSSYAVKRNPDDEGYDEDAEGVKERDRCLKLVSSITNVKDRIQKWLPRQDAHSYHFKAQETRHTTMQTLVDNMESKLSELSSQVEQLATQAADVLFGEDTKNSTIKASPTTLSLKDKKKVQETATPDPELIKLVALVTQLFFQAWDSQPTKTGTVKDELHALQSFAEEHDIPEDILTELATLKVKKTELDTQLNTLKHKQKLCAKRMNCQKKIQLLSEYTVTSSSTACKRMEDKLTDKKKHLVNADLSMIELVLAEKKKERKMFNANSNLRNKDFLASLECMSDVQSRSGSPNTKKKGKKKK